MTTPISREAALNYALASKENLTTAINLSEAFQDIKTRVIQDFLTGLEAAILSDYPGWKCLNDFSKGPFQSRYYTKFGFYKPAWMDNSKRFAVALETGPQPTSIGILRDGQEKILNGRLYEEIKNRFGKGYGKEGNTWDWYRNLDSPYQDWNSSETLLKMYENQEAREYFHTAFTTLMDIASDIIDQHLGL